MGTGFSYGDSYIDRMAKGTEEFLSFLDAFFKKYPEYAKPRPFYIAGESYAAKYIA